MMLAEIYDAYREDSKFDHLRRDGVPLVPGEGSANPKVLIVGEAPGAVENVQKRPFVGASGVALRSLISDVAGLEPEDYFITNTVKYWPGPGNRTPDWQEVEASTPYLREEYIALCCPPVILAAGSVALSVFRPEGETRSILQCAGKPISLKGSRTLWPMVHPAYALHHKPYRDTMEGHWETFGAWFRKEFW
jgi:DNA polymerase